MRVKQAGTMEIDRPKLMLQLIYQLVPIQTSRSEVRLISILPSHSADPPIRCELRRFSLLELRPQYEDFLRRHDFAATSPTAVQQAWIDESEGQSPDDGSSHIKPSTALHRYRWGDYAALSYTWGDPKDVGKVNVNGTEVNVTSNLARALEALREAQMCSGRFYLWVDALCINQSNHTERSEQVAAMRLLYSEAWSVISFIGQQADGSDRAIDLAVSLSAYHGNESKFEALRDQLVQHHDAPGSWLALYNLTLRPYWSRLWIVQELALGGTRVFLMCGSKSVTWSAFCKGLSVIHRHLWVAKNYCVNRDHGISHETNRLGWMDSGPMHHIWKDLWRLSEIKASALAAPRLGRLLEIANFSRSSDARDKVYGMLGLMDPALAACITPDYTVDAATVFRWTARAYIEVYRNLELLRDANIYGVVVRSTWVPDWTWRGRLRDSRPEDGEWRAHFGLDFVVPEFQGDLLECKAVIFDEVDGLGVHPEAEQTRLVQSQSVLSAYGTHGDERTRQLSLALCATGDQPSANNCMGLLHLPRTVDSAMEQFSRLGWTQWVQDRSYYTKWTSWLAANASLSVAGRELEAYFSDEVPSDARYVEYWKAYKSWTQASQGRRLATTKEGRLAWVPYARDATTSSKCEVQRGDVLAIFGGCCTPIVLRPTSQSGVFQVMGEAYVHGVMEGQIIQQADRYPAERIWLC